MKVYFGFTVAGDRTTVGTARRIGRLLEEIGHEVLSRHLVSDEAWTADRLISPQEVYQRDVTWLQECDLFIAEVSGSSFGLGDQHGAEASSLLHGGRRMEGVSGGFTAAPYRKASA